MDKSQKKELNLKNFYNKRLWKDLKNRYMKYIEKSPEIRVK